MSARTSGNADGMVRVLATRDADLALPKTDKPASALPVAGDGSQASSSGNAASLSGAHDLAVRADAAAQDDLADVSMTHQHLVSGAEGHLAGDASRPDLLGGRLQGSTILAAGPADRAMPVADADGGSGNNGHAAQLLPDSGPQPTPVDAGGQERLPGSGSMAVTAVSPTESVTAMPDQGDDPASPSSFGLANAVNPDGATPQADEAVLLVAAERQAPVITDSPEVPAAPVPVDPVVPSILTPVVDAAPLPVVEPVPVAVDPVIAETPVPTEPVVPPVEVAPVVDAAPAPVVEPVPVAVDPVIAETPVPTEPVVPPVEVAPVVAPPPPVVAMPTMTFDAIGFAENAAGVLVGRLSFDGPVPLDPASLTLSDARFEIGQDSQGYLVKLAAGAAINFEAEPSIVLTAVAHDSLGREVQASAGLLVEDVNEAPQVGTIALGALSTGSTLHMTSAQLLAGATDPDGDVLSVVGLELADPAKGTLQHNSDGSWDFTPRAGIPSGAAVFRVTVSDGAISAYTTAQVDLVRDMPVVQPTLPGIGLGWGANTAIQAARSVPTQFAGLSELGTIITRATSTYTNVDKSYSGTKNADQISVSGTVNQSISTAEGNDVLDIARDANASISMGKDNDTVRIGGNLNQSINLGEDNDILEIRGDANGQITGDKGNDSVRIGGNLNQAISLGEDDDALHVRGNVQNVVDLGDGNDRMRVDGAINAKVVLGRGNNVLTVLGDVNMTVEGDRDRDDIDVAGNANQAISLGDGNDVLRVGGKVYASLAGGAGTDTLVLTNYKYADYVNNVDSLSTRISGFERIEFSDKILSNGVVTSSVDHYERSLAVTTGDAAGNHGSSLHLTGISGDVSVQYNGQAVQRAADGSFDVALDASEAGRLTFSSANSLASLDSSLTLSTQVVAADGHLLGQSIHGNGALVGGAGSDLLQGGGTADVLYGGAGDDVFLTSGGADRFYGGDGNDFFVIDQLNSPLQVDGGVNWVDSLDLSARDLTAAHGNWTVTLDDHQSFNAASGADALNFATDTSGVITFDDGASIRFNNIEAIHWH